MTRRSGWWSWLARLALLAWPASVRKRDGEPMLAALFDGLVDRRLDEGSRVFWLVSECLVIAWTGVRLRMSALAEGVSRLSAGFRGDVRLGARTLVRNRGYAGAAVLTMALGLGGTAAVLGFVGRTVFDVPPYAQADRLVLVWNTLGDDRGRLRVAAPDVALFRERATSFSDIAFTNRVLDGSVAAAGRDGVEHARIAAVTSDFFRVLGTPAALGRTFASDPGDGPVEFEALAVLDHRFWMSAFAGARDVVGSTLRVNGVPVQVLGVMPEGFRLQLPPDAGMDVDADVWVPLGVSLAEFHRDDGRVLDQDSDNTGVAVARLRPGVTLEMARAEMAAIGMQRQREIEGYALADLRVDVRSMRRDALAHTRGLLSALLVGAAVLLLVAALNLSTLLLARGARRREELALRVALGADRLRTARVLLTENALLFVAGALGALVVAAFGGDLLTLASPLSAGSVGEKARLSAIAVGLIGGLALLVGGSSLSVLPALRGAHREGVAGPLALRRSSGTGTRRGLVCLQVALSSVLLTGAVLLVRSADELRASDPGFDPEGVLTFSVSLRAPERFGGPAQRARLMREVEKAVLAVPGARAVGLVGALPLGGKRWTRPYGLPGQSPDEWQENRADFRVVTSGYFEAMGIVVTAGRSFTGDEDLDEARRVVIVDEKLAARIAADGRAVGATIGIPLDGQQVEAEIVGVVGHVRHDDLWADGREAIYVPYRQEASREVAFVVRAEDDAAALAPSVRAAVRTLDDQIPVYDVQPMVEHLDAAVAPVRFGSALVGVFAFLTLIAACIGLYGVVAYEVSHRTRDIGLRMAVGASGASVQREILRDGLVLGVVGLAAGLGLSIAASVVLRPLVFGVSVFQPATWLPSAGLVFGLVLFASWVPARRASRLDPTVALRSP